MALAFGDTDADVPVVGVDDHAGAALAARHLAELGHRRFAILAMEFGEDHAGRVDAGAGRRRRLCHVARTGGGQPRGARGLRHRYRRRCRCTRPPGTRRRSTRRSRRLLRCAEPPTAILAHSDRIAMRALGWFRDRGIGVPGDVSIVGFDGVPEAALTDPPLTTVSQPIRELGRRAVEVIIGHGGEIRREVLDLELVVRASTAAPRRD